MGLFSLGPYISPVEAAALSHSLGHPISDAALRYKLRAGQVPGTVRIRDRWVLDRERFGAWLADRAQAGSQ